MLPERVQIIINTANALLKEDNIDAQSLDISIKDIITFLECYVHPIQEQVNARIASMAKPVCDQQGTPLTEENIKIRVRQLAEMIFNDQSVVNPVIISLMDGALPFAAMLQTELSHLQYQFRYATMRANSYDGVHSGNMTIETLPLKLNLACKTILVIDDVLDTGKTWYAVKKKLEKLLPETIKFMVLVDKVQERFDPEANADYVGFNVDKDEFIIGMGLDYNGAFRNSSSVSAVDIRSLPTGIEKEILQLETPLNKLLRDLDEKKSLMMQQSMLQQAAKQPSVAEFSIFTLSTAARSEASNELYPGLEQRQTPPLITETSEQEIMNERLDGASYTSHGNTN